MGSLEDSYRAVELGVGTEDVEQDFVVFGETVERDIDQAQMAFVDMETGQNMIQRETANCSEAVVGLVVEEEEEGEVELELEPGSFLDMGREKSKEAFQVVPRSLVRDVCQAKLAGNASDLEKLGEDEPALESLAQVASRQSCRQLRC